MVVAVKVYIAKKRLRLAVSRQMLLVYMICMAMCGNGVVTVMTRTTIQKVQALIRTDKEHQVARFLLIAVVPGLANRCTADPLTAQGTCLTLGSAATGFVLS